MSRAIFISPKSKNVGSLFVCLGVMQKFYESSKNIAFFKPIVYDENDYSIAFMQQRFGIKEQKLYVFTLKQTLEMFEQKRYDEFHLALIKRYKELLAAYDYICCEGLAREAIDRDINFDINYKIAQNFAVALINVARDEHRCFYDEKHYYFNILSRVKTQLKSKNIYSMPEVVELDFLSVEDVLEEASVKLLHKNPKSLDIKKITLLEQNIDEALDDELVVISAKNEKLLNEFLKSHKKPSMLLISSAKDELRLGKKSYTIATTKKNSFELIKELLFIKPRLRVNDEPKIKRALELFNSSVEFDVQKLSEFKSDVLTPYAFEYKLLELAKKDKKRVVLVESEDERVLRAAKMALDEDAVDILLLSKDEFELKTRAKNLGINLSGATIIEYEKFEKLDFMANELYNLRKSKGLSFDDAKKLLSEPNYFATMMVKLGFADGMLSGAIYSSANVIRPSLQIIKTKPDVLLASSLFFMLLEDRVVVFGDCALNQNPSSQELAQIAISCAKTAQDFGIEPRVAMLSYSTKDSGSGEDVELVKEALGILKQREPNLNVDGPMQYDVAVDRAIAKQKKVTSLVGGDASVFIFSDLNSGNTTYKAVQKSANVIAIGPILLGLNGAINDLSRGSGVKDIYNTILVTAIQGAAK